MLLLTEKQKQFILKQEEQSFALLKKTTRAITESLSKYGPSSAKTKALFDIQAMAFEKLEQAWDERKTYNF